MGSALVARIAGKQYTARQIEWFGAEGHANSKFVNTLVYRISDNSVRSDRNK
jgi:hypothetical protein